MDKPPIYNEWIHQYADTVIDIVIPAPVPDISSAKYIVYVQASSVNNNLGQSASLLPNLVDLTIGQGIEKTDTGLKITIPRASVQSLRGKYQHELSVINSSSALAYLFTGELEIKATNGRLN